jgi:hypothetical protein
VILLEDTLQIKNKLSECEFDITPHVIKKRLKQNKNKVANLLEEYPFLRNSDKLLVLAYWFFKNGITEIDLSSFENCVYYSDKITSPHTIIRLRQRLNSEGKFLATDTKVLQARNRKHKIMTEIFREKNDGMNTSIA